MLPYPEHIQQAGAQLQIAAHVDIPPTPGISLSYAEGKVYFHLNTL